MTALPPAFSPVVAGVLPDMDAAALVPVIDHLARLTDDTGVFEHAIGLIPRRSSGYTTDDVARALVVAVRWPTPEPQQLESMVDVYLGFLHDAITSAGTVRNRLSFDHRWQSETSADAHGRTIWGLAIAATEASEARVRGSALSELSRISRPRDASLRPGVYAALGAAALMREFPDDEIAVHILESVSASLPRIGKGGWIWPESRLTYDNARIPECYLALAQVTGSDRLRRDGLRLLEWLAATELYGDHFSFTPVGGRGPIDRSPLFDQQPLEATGMADACLRARDVTRDPRWLELATRAIAWFGGLNDARIPIYDPHTGAGHDGLTPSGVNGNAGAESTISSLWALQRASQLNLDFDGIVSKGPVALAVCTTR
jgi:hypothetical protein